MYYGLITISVFMFGVNFLFNNRYQKESGSGLGATLTFTFFGNLAGLAVLLIINRFRLEVTLFTVLMAGLATLNSVAYSFCSLKAFEHINLSLYSIFAMLGGMALPFVVGILFYREPLTAANGICLLLIAVALALTVKPGEKKKGLIYYAGVFVLNGMSGVLSKIFQAAPYEKTDAAGYSIWIAVLSVVTSGTLLLFMLKKVKKPTVKALAYTAGCGTINKVANYLLLLALAVLPASVQYPFVTGGTMIVSTAIGALMGQRPSRREVLAIALSFIGILILVLL
jgi:drug/metabolite transporter (DMT)-like permease